MGLLVACVIVPNVVAIYASMWPMLEMNIHFVIFQFPLLKETSCPPPQCTADRLHTNPQVIPQAHRVPIFFFLGLHLCYTGAQ